MKYFYSCILFFLALMPAAFAQGIIVNELSNGSSGSQEYMEFLVAGTPCTTVDLRTWMIDDNNGLDDVSCQGFGSTSAASGVATGHIRFKNISRWSAVPVGSIILVYNSADKNTSILLGDDPTDSDNNKVYVLPIDDSGLEECNSTPTASAPVNCTYSPATYAATTTSSWLRIGLRNSGDAVQTRKPDGTYFHGVSYGTSGNNMTGGVDGLKILNSDGTGKVIYFSCDNYRALSNFTSSATGPAETPGYANSTLNQYYIDYLQCLSNSACTTPLPIELVYFHAKALSNKVHLEWQTASETNNDYFTIERSADGKEFTPVKIVRGAGNSTAAHYYTSQDELSKDKVVYYSLKQTDFDGKFTYSNVVAVALRGINSVLVYPNPADGEFSVEVNGASSDYAVRLINGVGTVVYSTLLNAYSETAKTTMTGLPSGVFLLETTDLQSQERFFNKVIVR